MASFEPTPDKAKVSSSSYQGVKYPFRHVEPMIQKLVKVLNIDVDRLDRHNANITKVG